MNRTLRVLNVEDSEPDAALLRRHLSRAGYELISERVETFETMRTALQLQEWDVILCDYSLPHFNAPQALNLLKEMELDLPFIIVSGAIGEAAAVAAMRAGAHDYLMKDNLVRLAPIIERELHETENRRARRQAEAALRESEDRYRDLVEHSQELICTHDLSGQLLSVNSWAAEILGYTQTDLLKKNLRDFLVPEFRDQFDVYLGTIRRDGLARGLMVVETATGERRIWEYHNSLRTEGVGAPIVRGLTHDITEQKQAEEKLKQRENQLAEAQQLAHLASWNWDLQNNTLTWSDEHYRIFGLDPQVGADYEATITESVYLEDQQLVRSTVEHSLRTQQPFDFHYRINHPDGRLRVLHSRGDVVSDEHGIPLRMFGTAQDVTERSEAEDEQVRLNAQVEGQRQRLNSIVATVPGLVWEAWGEPDSASQRINFVSDYVETLLGYSVSEWLSTPNFWLSIVHPDDRERAAREAAAGFASRSRCTTEFRWITKDGRPVWIESNFIVITDAAGLPVGMRGVNTDISERKRAEAERLIIAEIVQGVITTASLDELFKLAHTAVSKLIYAENFFIALDDPTTGFKCFEYWVDQLDPVPLPRPAGKTFSGYVLRTGLPLILNKEIERDLLERGEVQESGTRAASWMGVPLRTRARTIGVLVLQHYEKEDAYSQRDFEFLSMVGYQIALAVERKQVEQEMRRSEERYRDLIENARDIIYTHDLEGNYTSANKASEEITGYTPEESLQMNIADTVAPEYLEKARSMVKGKLNSGRQSVYDLEIIAKDGHRVAVEVNTRLIFQGDVAVGVQGIARDITERKHLEGQLRQSQKLESIGHLAAGIAHEINTPTQYVGDNLRFMQESDQARTEVMKKYHELFEAAQSGSVSAELLEAVGRAAKEADLDYMAVEMPKALKQSLEGVERIAKIVQSMKDFAHPGSSEKKAVDLNRAIESTINVARGEWKYVAEMEMDFDSNLPPVPCLLGEMNQMTLNMIINSSHAIAEKLKLAGGGKGLIKITTRHEGDWAVMRISDTGGGIPAANRARVFDPFFTTKEVGKGTGQGLAISQRVVEKHGGTITFETVEGEGTTFIIRLPFHELTVRPEGLKEAA